MSTKIANIKRSANGSSAVKNGKASNGASPKAAKRKKSINERWIEKYGVDDSETARKFRKLWKMVYDSHNQSKH